MPGWRVVSRLALGPHPGRCGAVHAVGRGCRRVGGTRESLRWQPRRRRCAPGRAGGSQPGQPGDYEAEHEHPADADIRLGFPTWVMVSKDLILRPYQPLFFQRGASQWACLPSCCDWGPLPRHETVKLTVALEDRLDLYAVDFDSVHVGGINPIRPQPPGAPCIFEARSAERCDSGGTRSESRPIWLNCRSDDSDLVELAAQPRHHVGQRNGIEPWKSAPGGSRIRKRGPKPVVEGGACSHGSKSTPSLTSLPLPVM